MNKGKFPDLRKLVKQESNHTQRLQSLKLPRDLNLGGAKVPKKQFVPNLNVVRNKDKVKDVTKKIEHKRNIKNNGKQYQHNNSGHKYHQSSGIFSEGVGLDGKKTYWNGARRSNTKENDFTATMPVPTIKKNTWEFDRKIEENVFDEIMADDEESEDEKLPFQITSWNEKDFKDGVSSIPIKRDIKCDDIKSEPDEVPNVVKKIKLENSDVPIKAYQDSNLCSDQHPTLSLWRLPDSFAGKRFSDDPDDKKILDYNLHDMPEGQIGKFVLRKSGRVEIHIGRMKYNLESTEFGLCREEIVALDIKENQESTAAVLGQIQNRFLVNPDWDSLFSENKL